MRPEQIGVPLIMATVLAFTIGIAEGQNGKNIEEGAGTSPTMSLQDAISQASTQFPGQVVEAELEDEHGVMVYEVTIIGDDGRTREIEVDAKSGKLSAEDSEGSLPGKLGTHED